MTSMGEPWTPRLADPQVNKANPFAHSTVSNSLFVVELGLNPLASGPFRVARQEPGSPGEAKAGATFKVLPPTVLATCVEWPSPTLQSVSCPCAFASTVSSNWSPSPHLPSSVSQPYSAFTTPLWSPVFREDVPIYPSFNSTRNVSFVLPEFSDLRSHR